MKDVSPAGTETAVPVIMSEGNYRLYRKPGGTMRLQFREKTAGEDAFFEFPAALLVMAQRAAAGDMNPVQMMKELAKMMGGIRG